MRDLLQRIDFSDHRVRIALGVAVALVLVVVLWPRGGATADVSIAPSSQAPPAQQHDTAQPVARTQTTPSSSTSRPVGQIRPTGSYAGSPQAPPNAVEHTIHLNGHRLNHLDPNDQSAPRNPDADPVVAHAGDDLTTWWKRFSACEDTGKDWRICETDTAPGDVEFIQRKGTTVRLQVRLQDGRTVFLFLTGETQCHAIGTTADCNAW